MNPPFEESKNGAYEYDRETHSGAFQDASIG